MSAKTVYLSQFSGSGPGPGGSGPPIGSGGPLVKPQVVNNRPSLVPFDNSEEDD